MMMTRLILLLVLLLTACTPPLPAPPPLVTPVIWQVQITPTLGWISPLLASCAKEQPGIHLVVLERPAPSLDSAVADFIIRWGPPASLASPSTIIAEDELVFIVHPSNPVSQLTTTELRSLLIGKTVTWNQVLPAASKETLKVYTYGDGEDIQSVLENIMPGLAKNRETGWLAPDPGAVRQAVASSPVALGYLPKRWLDASVKVLRISDLAATGIRQPVLVVSRTVPEGSQKEFLHCLTGSAR